MLRTMGSSNHYDSSDSEKTHPCLCFRWFSRIAVAFGTKWLGSPALPFSSACQSGTWQRQAAIPDTKQQTSGHVAGGNKNYIEFSKSSPAGISPNNNAQTPSPLNLSAVYSQTSSGVSGTRAGFSNISPISETSFANDHECHRVNWPNDAASQQDRAYAAIATAPCNRFSSLKEICDLQRKYQPN